jgi:hypothetical protein
MSAVALFFVVLSLFSFFGIQIQQNSFPAPAFLSEFFSLFFFLITQISNTLSLTLIKLSFSLLAIKLFLFRFFNFNSNFVFETFSQEPAQGKAFYQNLKNSQTLLTLENNYSLSLEAITLSHSLSKVNFALSKLYDSDRFDNILLSLTQQNYITRDFNFFLYELLSFEECSESS